MFVSIEVELRKEKKRLKDYMNKSIFDQYMNNNKQLVMMKARQTGKSSVVASSLLNWKVLYDKYNRRLLRKESIKRIFNI